MGFRELVRDHNNLVSDHNDLLKDHHNVAASLADLTQEHRETRGVLISLMEVHNRFVSQGFFQRLRWLFGGLRNVNQQQRGGPPVEVEPGQKEEPREGHAETHGETGA